jgi:hypothetical protein
MIVLRGRFELVYISDFGHGAKEPHADAHDAKGHDERDKGIIDVRALILTLVLGDD